MTNKLAQSTSPYLQQHADNPVYWQQWGHPVALVRLASAEVNAFICQGVICLAPLTDTAKLQEALKLSIVSD